MFKFWANKRAFSLIAVVLSMLVGVTAQAGALNEDQLRKLVSGNSTFGAACPQNSLYEFYFDPKGQLLSRKTAHKAEIQLGRWWIKGETISLQWPDDHKHLKTSEVKLYRFNSSLYRPLNVNNTCGQKGTFGPSIFVIPGKIESLDKTLKKSALDKTIKLDKAIKGSMQ